MVDVQLPMFDDLRFWSVQDLLNYQQALEDDISSARAAHALHAGDERTRNHCEQAIHSINEELDAIHRELAYRSLLK